MEDCERLRELEEKVRRDRSLSMEEACELGKLQIKRKAENEKTRQ